MGCGASTPAKPSVDAPMKSSSPAKGETPAPAAAVVPKLNLAVLKQKTIKEWSGDEVRDILAIFRQFDANGDGHIDSGELQALCDIMGIESTVEEADTYTTDGKIDPQEFFAFYVGCTREEAANAFVSHAQQFDELRAKGSLKEYTEQEVKDVLAIFKQFDADNSGYMDAGELQALCDVLCIEASVEEADTFKADGKIGTCEFFAFYVGCSREEAEQVFDQHTMVFAAAEAGSGVPADPAPAEPAPVEPALTAPAEAPPEEPASEEPAA